MCLLYHRLADISSVTTSLGTMVPVTILGFILITGFYRPRMCLQVGFQIIVLQIHKNPMVPGVLKTNEIGGKRGRSAL